MENDSTKETDIMERIRIKNISIRQKKLIERDIWILYLS